jgi:hypothetical protein
MCLRNVDLRSADYTALYHRRQFKKYKAISVIDHGGPYDCETSRLIYFLDSRLTDCGEIASLKRRPPFTHTKRKTPELAYGIIPEAVGVLKFARRLE